MKRDYRLLLTAQVISSLGSQLLPTATAFILLESGYAAAVVGVVFAASMAGQAATVLFGGVLSGRMPCRLVMSVSGLLAASAQVTAGTVVATRWASTEVLVASQFLLGGATGIYGPAVQTLLPRILPRERLQRGNAVNSAVLQLSSIIGPALAGIIVAAGLSRWMYFMDAISFALLALLVLTIRGGATTRTGPKSRSLAQVKETALTCARDVQLRGGFVHLSVLNLIFAAVFVLAPISLAQTGDGAERWSVAMTCIAVGGFLAGVVGSAHQLSKSNRLAAMRWLGVLLAPAALLVTPHSFLLFAVFGLCAGFAVTMTNICWNTEIQTRCDEDRIGLTYAFARLLSVATRVVAYLIAPALLALSSSATLGYGIGIALLTWVFITPLRRQGSRGF